jgi:hypothetical protein
MKKMGNKVNKQRASLDITQRESPWFIEQNKYLSVVKFRRLHIIGQTCRDERNARGYCWENLLVCANLEKGEGDGNRG